MTGAPDTRVLVIGGTGNFGSRICRLLAKEGLHAICGGRDAAKLDRVIAGMDGVEERAVVDIDGDLNAALRTAAPDIVIHTKGPFQEQDFRVAEACIAAGVHYIDLSDARAFTQSITTLDGAARDADVLVVSGASSVPGLTSALMAECRDTIPEPRVLDVGISAARRPVQGVATTAAVLTYCGAPFKGWEDGALTARVGWHGLRRVKIEGLGARWLADCDIPDLSLFPDAYPSLRTMRFGAGVDGAAYMFGFRIIAAARRVGLIRQPARLAPVLTNVAALLESLGSDRSGFFFDLEGFGGDGRPRRRRFDLVAGSGDGPYIPCLPSVALAVDLARGQTTRRGATACMELLSSNRLLTAMKPFDIDWTWRDQPV